MELNPITQSLLLTAVVCAVLAAVRPELGFAAIVFLVPFLVSATLVARALEREMRRQVAEQDAAILREWDTTDELDELVNWSVAHTTVED